MSVKQPGFWWMRTTADRLMTDLAVRRTVAAKRDGPDDYHTTPSPTTVVVGRAVGGVAGCVAVAHHNGVREGVA